MSHEDLIVRVFPGHVLSDEFFDKVVSEYNTVFGAASVKDGKIVMVQFDQFPKPDQIKGLIESFKDSELLMHFGKSVVGYTAESMQPFGLIGDDVGDKLIAFLSGDFSNLAEPKGSHSGPAYAVSKILRPKMDMLFNASGGSMKKLMEQFKSPVVFHDMTHLGVSNTSVMFLPIEGEISIFNTSDRSKTFDGFWASDHLGFGQDQKELPLSKESSSNPLLNAMLGSKPADMKEIAPPKDNKEGPVDRKPEPDEISVVPPKDINSKNDLQWFYAMWSGDGKSFPSDYRQRPQIKVNKAKWQRWCDLRAKGTVIKDIKKLQEAMTRIPADAGATKTEKTSTAETVKGESVIWPHLSPDERNKIDDFLKQELVKKLLGSEAIKDGMDVDKVLAERGKEGLDFAVVMGLKGGLDATSNWSYGALRLLAKTAGENAVCILCSNWMHRALEWQTLAESSSRTTDTKAEEEIKATGTEDAKPETTPKISNKYANINI